MILFLFVIGVTLIIIGLKLKKLAYLLKEKANSYNLENMNHSNENKNPLDKNLKIKSDTGEEFNVSLKVRTSWNDNDDNHYEISREYTGESEDGSYAYKYTNSNGETGTGWTSESPERFKERKIIEEINEKKSSVTIKYKGIEYDRNKINKISDEVYERKDSLVSENHIPDIKIDENLSAEKKKELLDYKTRIEANSWKSRQRSLRKKGKLEDYKIDALNKLGMLWNPKENEWEKKYIKYKKWGLCDEIEDWVKEQRNLYKDKKINKENLYRLKAINFPFIATENEQYKFTTDSIWDLKLKIGFKEQRFVKEQMKKKGVYKEIKIPKKIKSPKKIIKKKLSEKELKERNYNILVGSFYQRKYQYTDRNFVKKIEPKEAMEMIEFINSGKSIINKRLKEFFEIEFKKYKELGKRIPTNIKYESEDLKDENISSWKIYHQLSFFIVPKLHPDVRLKASKYMLNHISSLNLRDTKSFKEINYLISHYRKEKNKNKLIFLADFVQKYPVLEELYLEKINDYISRIK